MGCKSNKPKVHRCPNCGAKMIETEFTRRCNRCGFLMHLQPSNLTMKLWGIMK